MFSKGFLDVLCKCFGNVLEMSLGSFLGCAVHVLGKVIGIPWKCFGNCLETVLGCFSKGL